MSLLEIKHVSKKYENHVALNDVSLEVSKGSIFGLLGPNGAGKTTLIRIINNITMPDEGEVLLDGKLLRFEDTAQIGYLPEERGLYKQMKVGEQALYLAQLKGMSRSEALESLVRWFKHLGIESWWDKKVAELSKGMAQKVQFITTVIHKPKLLIFDEPFSGFDPVNAHVLKQEILKLRDEGATIIFSTHNMSSVEELCDDIALINHSKVVLSGDVKSIKQQFKGDTYWATIDGDIVFNNENVEVLERCFDGYSTKLHLKVSGDNMNELLRLLMNYGEVLSFERQVPTMDDIFIRTVKGE